MINYKSLSKDDYQIVLRCNLMHNAAIQAKKAFKEGTIKRMIFVEKLGTYRYVKIFHPHNIQEEFDSFYTCEILKKIILKKFLVQYFFWSGGDQHTENLIIQGIHKFLCMSNQYNIGTMKTSEFNEIMKKSEPSKIELIRAYCYLNTSMDKKRSELVFLHEKYKSSIEKFEKEIDDLNGLLSSLEVRSGKILTVLKDKFEVRL